MEKKDALFSSKKEQWDFVIAIIVIALVAFFIYSKTFTNSDAEGDSMLLLSATTTDTSPITYSHTKEDCPDTDSYKTTVAPKRQQTEKTTSVIPLYNDSNAYTSSSDYYATPNTTQPSTTAPTKQLETQTPETITAPQIVEETEQDIEILEVKEVPLKETSVQIDTLVTQTLHENIPVARKDAVKNTTIQNQTTTITNTTQSDCLVIIGVYQEKANEIAAITKLTELGYSHEVGTMRNQLRFVGVPVSCDDKKQKRTLIRELNNSFGISAWVKEK